MDTPEQVAESLRIEGIDRPPTDKEIAEHRRFMRLETLTISELEAFLKVFRPGARLRLYPGRDNIIVGPHVPPKSGDHIAAQLQALLTDINEKQIDAWSAHVQFETLHPFSDGNGRVGRVIWYAMSAHSTRVELGFLHGFYLQTLNKFGRTDCENFLIHPELATSCKVDWPDVDLDKSSIDKDDAHPDILARQLAGLGYPGLAHLDHVQATPAVVLCEMILQKDLEARLTEALPWIVLTYPDLDWPWLVREMKLWDAQNRLGFIVALAQELAATRSRFRPALEPICAAAKALERARLAREDTLCRESMPPAERDWLLKTRSPLARHWNLVTGLTADQLSHVL